MQRISPNTLAINLTITYIREYINYIFQNNLIND